MGFCTYPVCQNLRLLSNCATFPWQWLTIFFSRCFALRMRRFSHMTSTLSTVVIENAEVFAKILRNCGLPQVADWKLEDVKRAFNWAQYFQKVGVQLTSTINSI